MNAPNLLHSFRLRPLSSLFSLGLYALFTSVPFLLFVRVPLPFALAVVLCCEFGMLSVECFSNDLFELCLSQSNKN